MRLTLWVGYLQSTDKYLEVTIVLTKTDSYNKDLLIMSVTVWVWVLPPEHSCLSSNNMRLLMRIPLFSHFLNRMKNFAEHLFLQFGCIPFHYFWSVVLYNLYILHCDFHSYLLEFVPRHAWVHSEATNHLLLQIRQIVNRGFLTLPGSCTCR